MPGMETILLVCAVALFSYLLGSVNFAIIVSRVYAGDDVRRHGSGNAGMTNMLRTYGKGPAAVTAAGDFLKAAAAICLSRIVFSYFAVPLDAGYPAGLFVVLGHVFPLFFRFKGGKAIMAMLGVICCTNLYVFAVVVLIFLPLALISRIVSLASVLGAICYPFITWTALSLQGKNALTDTVWAGFLGVLLLILHRENIKRLLTGTEHKFGEKKTDDTK